MATLAYLAPVVVRPIYLGVTILTAPLGLVIGELLMLLVYYGVVCPLGILGRLLGRDRLHLKRDASSTRTSYWRTKKRPEDVRSYYRQS